MPLVQLVSSAAPPGPEARARLLGTLSRLLAERFGKPEQWVMTSLLPRAEMTFAGTGAPACYVEIKNIGAISPELARAVSADVTRVVADALAVPPERIYIELTDAPGHLWGHAGDTFA